MDTNINSPVTGLNFGQAVEALKAGRRVSRAVWNGKGMYLWLLPAALVKSEWCKEPHLKYLAEFNGGEVECLGSIRMFTADRKVLTGWLASQTDILAEDWQVFPAVVVETGAMTPPATPASELIEPKTLQPINLTDQEIEALGKTIAGDTSPLPQLTENVQRALEICNWADASGLRMIPANDFWEVIDGLTKAMMKVEALGASEALTDLNVKLGELRAKLRAWNPPGR